MTTPEQPDAGGPKPSAFALALHVFDDPVQTFRTLVRFPVFALPIILIVIVAGIGAIAVPGAVLRQATQRTYERIEQRTGKPLPDSVKSAAVNKAAAPTRRAIGVVSQTVVGVLWLVILAAVMKLIFGAGAADPITFRQEFAMAAHANLVVLLGGLVTIGMILATGRLNVSVSLGFLAPSGFAHAYLSRLTVWGAWDVFLLAMGNKVLGKADSLTGPLVIIGGLWLAVNIPLALLTGFMS